MSVILDLLAGYNCWECSILVVDDDLINLEVTKHYLEKVGFEVLTAQNGETCLETVRMVLPDLVLMDVRMPKIDGFEACRRMKAEASTQKIPVLFMTGDNETDSIVKGFQAGAADYLAKPIRVEELLARVIAQLRLRDMTEDLEQRVQERKEALLQLEEQHHKLKERDALLRQVIDLMPHHISAKDKTGKFLLVNQAHAEFFGLTVDELVGKNLRDLPLKPEELEQVQENDRKVIESGKRQVIPEAFITDQDQKTHVMQINKIPLNLYGVETALSVSVDMTELKDTQSQMVQSEKMASLGILVGGVAHEINNPVNFVQGGIQNVAIHLKELKDFIFEIAGENASNQLLQSFEERFAKLSVFFETILSGSARIQTIVSDLNTFSRLDEADKKAVHILGNIESTLRLIKPKYESCVAFVYDFKADPQVECWPTQLNQVFMNIIVNACQAIIKKQQQTQDKSLGQLTISTELEEPPEGAILAIRFQDTGSGMSRKVQEKVFEPFYSTRPVGEGAGLGMSIAYEIVEKHQGSLTVQSVVNEGSTFTVRLPT